MRIGAIEAGGTKFVCGIGAEGVTRAASFFLSEESVPGGGGGYVPWPPVPEAKVVCISH